ncbi:DUF4440 domain-containing protein [Microvirga sp. GCM10011540]|uniref:nuclear transport factor 2 family protein n=1 Tax=Microvirga sp. GCM10011540 TaxID=3317338 RepID=UPI0036065D07
MDDITHFYELETSLLRPEVRASRDALSKLLANDFVEFGSSGRVYDRDQVIEGLNQESSYPAPGRMTYEFSVRRLSEVVALVTYRVSRRMPDGEEFQTRRSSIWQLIGGRWQMVFHQGTPVHSLEAVA